ncbi:DUF7426 family protein [Nonomuraea wenchangensis]|uniref:DUF7426 domain-containing protein n=1 Tax=Nonomuraea wenchangensis TaxID=568860 RepID=A0A1I0LVA0_9ACTN|nr:hypothetical protein [Nonomuraea wenchangensis]SEU46624.1 hypothetical protein SAMN05421811_12797 [Nonomuraea wenchangensis]
MMAQFRNLDEFFDPYLRLPVGGKTYAVPPPNGEVGLLVQRLMHAGIAAEAGQDVDAEGLGDLAKSVLEGDSGDSGDTDLYQRILGPVWDELFADKLDWPVIQHIGETAMLWIAAGADAAAKHWEAGAGEAEAPNRKARRAAAAQARSTRSRGSRSGTTRTTDSA